MGKENLTWDVSVKGHQAEEALKRLEDQADKTDEAMKKTGEAIDDHSEKGKGLTGIVGEMVSEYGKLAVSMAGITAVARSGLEVYERHLDVLKEVAERNREVASEQTALNLINEPGQMVAAQQQAVLAGAEKGIAAKEALMTQQEQQSVWGLEKGTAAASVAMDLQRIGVDRSAANSAITFGKELGLSPEDSAKLVMGAAESSAMGPEQMAAAMPGILAFRGSAEFGGAVLSVLSKSNTPERLRAAAEAAGRGLMGESKFTETLGVYATGKSDEYARLLESDEKGDKEKAEAIAAEGAELLDGMNPEQRFRLAGKMMPRPEKGYTAAGLQKAGLGSYEEARSLASVFENANEAMRVAEDIRNTDAGAASTAHAQMLENDPAYKEHYVSQRGVALKQAGELYGRWSEAAREEEARSYKFAAEVDADPHLTDEQGRVGKWTRRGAEMRQAGAYGGVGAYVPGLTPSVKDRDTRPQADQALESQNEAFNRLAEKMDETNGLLRDISGNTKETKISKRNPDAEDTG